MRLTQHSSNKELRLLSKGLVAEVETIGLGSRQYTIVNIDE